ncbi:hypothetical protein Tco_0988255 [Tanacetum coccineum]|uniref:Uncharacterized protein n=1 Tax=Tanacetum coccineum TaxID=301880 RepID=A0ABQ5EQH7_9ASTR
MINNGRRREVKYRQSQEVLVDIPERITEHGLSLENTQSSSGSSDASEGIPCIESLLAMCLVSGVSRMFGGTGSFARVVQLGTTVQLRTGRAVGHDRAVWQELNNISLV